MNNRAQVDRKRVIYFFVIVAVIFLSACTGGGYLVKRDPKEAYLSYLSKSKSLQEYKVV